LGARRGAYSPTLWRGGVEETVPGWIDPGRRADPHPMGTEDPRGAMQYAKTPPDSTSSRGPEARCARWLHVPGAGWSPRSRRAARAGMGEVVGCGAAVRKTSGPGIP